MSAVRVCTRCKAPVVEEHDPYMVGKFGRWKCPEELYAPIEVEMVETEKRRIVIELEQMPAKEEDDVSAAAIVEARVRGVIEEEFMADGDSLYGYEGPWVTRVEVDVVEL